MIPLKINLLQNRKEAIITDEDGRYKDILSGIRHKLSYIIPGMMFSKRFSGRGWNGRKYLMDKKGRFPIGLLYIVLEQLKEINVSYEIIDNRAEKSKSKPIDLTNRLSEINRLPRWYQDKAVEAAVNNDMGIIKAATGSGKTQIASMIAAKFGKKTIIYVIGKDLLYQFKADFEKVFQKPIGIVGDGLCDIRDITIISIWTIGQALSIKPSELLEDGETLEKEDFDVSNKAKIISCLKNAKVHIFDECHISSCKTIEKIHSTISPEHIYGLSGTPFKIDETDLLIKSILGSIIIDIDASTLIDEGVLAKPLIKFIDIPNHIKESSKLTYNEIYSQFVIENDYRNNVILEQAKKLISKGYQVLVLFNNIKHGNILEDLFQEAGVNFEILNGNDDADKRDIVKKKALAKEIDCIIASRIFDIGIDIPTISALVLAGSGKSYVKAMQRIGRAIRFYPGKKVAAIVEFQDNIKYLKDHSKRRKEIYLAERSFKLI